MLRIRGRRNRVDLGANPSRNAARHAKELAGGLLLVANFVHTLRFTFRGLFVNIFGAKSSRLVNMRGESFAQQEVYHYFQDLPRPMALELAGCSAVFVCAERRRVKFQELPMIKNERQYRFTKAQANRFSQTLQSLGEADGVHPLIVKAQREALSSQIADLEGELREYESLTAGRK